jgi:hypothetical protein
LHLKYASEYFPSTGDEILELAMSLKLVAVTTVSGATFDDCVAEMSAAVERKMGT